MQDIAAGELYKAQTVLLARQVATMNSRIRADLLSRLRGVAILATTLTENARLKPSDVAGWKATTEADTRFRQANTELWLWRGPGAIAGYIWIIKPF